LGAFEKERSRSPNINAIVREIALDLALAEYQPTVEYAHVAGKRNEWADALSRLAQPAVEAVVLGPFRACVRSAVPARGAAWWKTAF
jgi:hypothetical protein